MNIMGRCCGADVEAGFTFAPELNQRSERLLEDSQQLPGDFFARQRFFHDLKLRRLRVLQAEVGLLSANYLIEYPDSACRPIPFHFPNLGAAAACLYYCQGQHACMCLVAGFCSVQRRESCSAL